MKKNYVHLKGTFGIEVEVGHIGAKRKRKIAADKVDGELEEPGEGEDVTEEEIAQITNKYDVEAFLGYLSKKE